MFLFLSFKSEDPGSSPFATLGNEGESFYSSIVFLWMSLFHDLFLFGLLVVLTWGNFACFLFLKVEQQEPVMDGMLEGRPMKGFYLFLFF